ncbi:MAG: polysaccharide deacetylase family protein [Clostridia bacterium]|nr:polysaccharide deacetylase family protein [Clostridia bacterium]
MKKKILFSVFSALIASSLVTGAAAEQNDFYIMRKKDNERPALDAGLGYITEHNGYYIGPDEKVIYLTFDAGYENGNVARIVETLDRHGAKGTFFVLENFIKRNTDLLMRMAENGHTIANHSMRHKNMTAMSKEECEAELYGLESLYKELTGKTMSKFFRPPEGKCSASLLDNVSELGYKTVFWSFAYADWDNSRQPTRDYAVKLILDNTHNGEIILLHPTSKTNADIMDTLLLEWEARGYRFGTLDELS